MMMTRKKRKINLCFVTLVKVLTFDVGYESNTICCCLALQYLKRAGSLSWYGLDMIMLLKNSDDKAKKIVFELTTVRGKEYCNLQPRALLQPACKLFSINHHRCIFEEVYHVFICIVIFFC